MARLRRSRLFLLLSPILLSLLLPLSSCGSETPAPLGPTADTGVYKIGAVFSTTGSNSAMGTSERDAAQLAVDQINAKGGVNGRELELIVYDTGGDEVAAVNAVKKLAQEDRVLAVIGPSSTTESLAVLDAIQRAKIPLLSCASNSQIIQPGLSWIFKTPPNDSLAVRKIYAYLKKQGTTDVAVLTSNGEADATGLRALQNEAKDLGINIITSETFGENDHDMTLQIARIKASSAKALIVWGGTSSAVIAAKSAKTADLEVPLYMTPEIGSREFIQLAGDAADGITFPGAKLLILDKVADADPQKAVLTDYANSFQKRYGRAADIFGGYAFDAIALVAGALERAGPDEERIRQELENTKGTAGTTGVFNLTRQDHNGLGEAALVMIKIVDGKWTPAE